MLDPHRVLFLALTGVGTTHLALNLLEWEYFNHFDYVVLLYTQESKVVLDQSLHYFHRTGRLLVRLDHKAM